MQVTVVGGSVETVAKVKKKKAPSRVIFWSSECKYCVIIDRANEMEWRLLDDEKQENKANLLWIDVATIHERIRNIQPWQTINHFPGMPNIARKNRMGQNLNKMLKLFPKEYSFYPRTWILPGELADFRSQFDGNGNSLGNKIYIIKPDAGCQGRGIFLTRTWDTVPCQENVVAQLYIKKPLLIDGYKFDLRLYCLVTSVKPLRMYLFQDGLVRMCTEEYVKPTKQNISNVCMHLTNYAVNKHNENFLQPSAKSSEECQDEGSKRSLMWFMNSVRKDKGDAKADWLWRRMGTLCTRTVLSIIPVLSREYDQHFKSFSGVPVDLSKLAASTGYAAIAKGLTAKSGPGVSSVGANGRNTVKPAAVGAEDEEEEGAEEEADTVVGTATSSGTESPPTEGVLATTGAATTAGEAANTAENTERKYPKTRGSRCFEILGFDIMLDSALKPWLIEVNHLPSFGTDSPLDKDIKERLMAQVFSVLPVMADDHQAYLLHHKAESEKRLVAQRSIAKAAEELEKKKKAPPMRRREPVLPPVKDQNSGGSGGSGEQTEAPASLFATPQPPTDPSATEDADLTTAVVVAPAESSSDDDDEEPLNDEECTPERLTQIKAILRDVYQRFSPEKTSKIDRLLAKYLGHEEEFLRFVFSKYHVKAKTYRNFGQPVGAAASGTAHAAAGSEGSRTDDAEGKSDSAVGKERASSLAPKSRIPSNNREVSKRYSRSMSPPRSGTIAANAQKRPVASWKSSGPDEDAAFRAEVLAAHVPDESDEWMQFELSRLTQFTRIFPPEHLSKDRSSGADGKTDGASAAAEDEDGRDDDNEDDDEAEGAGEAISSSGGNVAGGTAGGDTNGGADSTAKASKAAVKATPIEEILFQIFVQDKRQTMRLRCPLPNRAKTDDNAGSFLPPLEQPQSSRTSAAPSTLSGKGTVGWKAPPKPQPKEPLKPPSETQAAAAKRLSQGLSVNSNGTSTHRMRGNASTTHPYGNSSSSSFSVVLDSHEYPPLYDGSIFAPQQPPQQLLPSHETSPWLATASTKASRLLEERNMNRIRIEQAKAHSAAVLRQQVFHFDPNYDPLGAAGGNIIGAPGYLPLEGAGGLAGGGSVMGGGSMVAGGPVPPYGGGSGSGHVPAHRGGARGSFNGMDHLQRQQFQQQQQLQHYQSQSNGVGGGPAGSNNHTQEELLKQLFPSWF